MPRRRAGYFASALPATLATDHEPIASSVESTAMRALVVAAAVLLLGATAAERGTITAETVPSVYQQFERLTAQPKEVSAWISMLCRTRGPSDYERERERAGPHAFAQVHLYVHGVDGALFAQPERQFPVGTIVVKEKLTPDLTAEGIGGMQKMEPGYDPEGGDWRYFYWSQADGFTAGRLDNCRSCHLGAKASDFVFAVGSNGRLLDRW
jgi:hypothetical protein